MLINYAEFIVLESLLQLFARILPSTNHSTRGRGARMDFIRSVFVQSSPENKGTGEKICKLLERLSTTEWEPTALKILETFAAANISL